MAAVTMTAADVRPLPGSVVRRFTAVSTVNSGTPVYLDSDGKIAHAIATGRATARVIGIAAADGDGSTIFLANDAVDVVVFGPVAGGSSLAEGSFAYCGTTAGGMEDGTPGSGNYRCIVGVPHSSSILFVNPVHTDAIDTA
jgi:hypothetical protein